MADVAVLVMDSKLSVVEDKTPLVNVSIPVTGVPPFKEKKKKKVQK